MKKDLPQLFDEFIFECEFVRKTRPETLQGYRNSFSTLNKICPDITIENVNTAQIIQFFKTLEQRKRIVGKGVVKVGIKKSTVASHWNKLNSFFRWMNMKGYMNQNPFSSLGCPRPIYEDKKFLKKEEIEKIVTAILTGSSTTLLLKRNLAIFYLLIFCGLRREELVLLQIRDIDFDRKELIVRAETSKSQRTRLLPLHSQVVMSLKDYLKERKEYTSQYLIISASNDDKLSYDGLKHLVKKLCRMSGVNFHLHQFRHTFAVNFLVTNNNVVKLSQLLGHRDISTTMGYLRCLPTKELRSDVENMSIDNFI